MAPTSSTSDPRSVWFSSLRPPLDLQPVVPPEDDDDGDDRAVAELLNAALAGDLSRAKKLVKELSKAGKGVDEAVAAAAAADGVAGTKRRGPLHMAAANGNVEICRILIKSNCDVDAIDSDGATPLVFAIQGLGSAAIVRLLLNNGANLNKADNNGVAPLHIAAERGFYEVAELLLAREAEVDLICENGGTPICIAAANGHAKILKLLLQHKADYNAGNPPTALVIAAGKGFTDCIKFLLKAGADANKPDEDGKLPVQIAACQGWKECVEILLPATTHLAEYATWSVDRIIQHEKTASSKQQLQVSDLDDKENAVSDDNTKDTQPHQSKSCSEKGKALTTVEGTFLEKELLADPKSRAKEAFAMASTSNVALQAAIDGNLSLLKMMARQVNLQEAKDDKGKNALHLAAEKGHLEVCRFLVEESGFDVDSVSAEGRRPVHGAAAGGSENVLQYLLDCGGNPVMPDSKGSTPLHDAAEEGHCEAVRLLLSKGVNVEAITVGTPPKFLLNKRTPLHLAAFKGKDQVLKILLEHGADAKKVIREYFTPLLAACFGRSLKCMELLVQAGAKVNCPILLMEAVNRGLTDVVKFLLEAGADPNIPDKNGRILIIRAAVYGKRELVELLFPRTTPIPYLSDWSVDGIISNARLLYFHAKVSQVSAGEPDDIEMEEYVQGFCNGSLAKKFNLFGGADVVGSKTKGCKLLCQAFRYIIDMFIDKKRSWGGVFTPHNLRVTRTGRFRINLEPALPAKLEFLWADLLGITNSLSAYFVLGGGTAIYVRHLFDLCRKLQKGVARSMDNPDSVNRYLMFIYNHPSFGFSTERGDLIKGFGMTLKYSSTTDITAIEACLNRVSNPDPKKNWTTKVSSAPVLKAVYWSSLNKDNKLQTHFTSKPKDNFLFCRHSLEHGAERTLIKTGGNAYKMFCPLCKQPVKSKYQQEQVIAAASTAGTKYQWAVTERKTESNETVQTQTQPLQHPEELDLLVGNVFDEFIANSICEILLEPKLDRNSFLQARWKAFKRSICPELNDEELNEREGKDDATENAGEWRRN